MLNKLLRWFILLLPALLVGILFIPPRPAHAQEEWCYIFNFLDDDGGWEGLDDYSGYLTPAEWSSSTGWAATPNAVGLVMVIHKSFTSTEITYMKVTYDNEGGTGGTYVFGPVHNFSPNYASAGLGGGEVVIETTPMDTTGDLYVAGNHNDTGGHVWIKYIELHGTGTDPFGEDNCGGGGGPGGDLVRPFSTADENPTFGVYDNQAALETITGLDTLVAPYDQFRVFAWSDNPQAFVMAAGAGTVTAIQPFSPAGLTIPCGLLLNTCLVAVPHDNPPESDSVIDMYGFESTNLYQVTLTLDDGGEELVYWLANAPAYVSVGRHIGAGCILGQAIPVQPVNGVGLLRVNAAVLPLVLQPGDSDKGMAFVAKTDLDDEQEDDAFTTLAPELTAYDDPANACNADPRFTDCMVNNPQLLNQGEGWQTDGLVTWLDGAGAILQTGGSVSQQLELMADTEYRIVISLTSVQAQNGIPASVGITLGDQSQSFTISPGDSGQYDMTVTPAPDIGGQFYSVRVTNLGTANLTITGICVGAGNQLVSNNCLLQNNSFDFDLSQWTYTEGVLWSNGQAWVPAGGSMFQNVTFAPDDIPVDYDVQISLLVWGNESWDGTGDLSIDLLGRGDDGSTTLAVDTGWNLAGHLGYPNLPQVLTDSFSAAGTVGEDFEIDVGTPSNEDILGVKIESICIIPHDEAGGFPVGTCQIVSEPGDNNIGSWISYLWHQLNRFFQCQLMIFLNDQLNYIRAFFSIMLYVARYFIASGISTANWLGQELLPWLAGHFRNIATGQITTVVSDAGCHDVFCTIVNVINTLTNSLTPLIQALANAINGLVAILTGGVGVILTIFVGLVGFVVSLLTRLFTLINFGLHLLGSIITAFNTATPISIPGLPTCASDPNSSLICMAVWVMDNTIFKDRWGTLFTIILALLSVHLLLWAIGEFRDILLKAGQSS